MNKIGGVELGPMLIKTIDGKTYVQLIKVGTVEIDGVREWSICIAEKDIKGSTLKRGKSYTFPLVALVEVIK